MTPPFQPNRIYVDRSVAHLPLTQKILSLFSQTAVEIISDPKKLKKPREMTPAKKGLFLTRFKADHPIKPFGANAKSLGRPYFSLNLVSNCHLECTYCILQSYLSNNPMITIYTNRDEILEKMGAQMKTLPPQSVIGTGQIADSLALEPVTQLHRALIPFFGREEKCLLELKTKSGFVDPILDLDHRGRTVVSWSLNPPSVIEREEFKTASLIERLKAAKRCMEAGYKIGFHLDPMISHENWKENYAKLVEQIFEAVPPRKIAWISLGTLRFPARQARIMKKRFPKSEQIFDGLRSTHLPYLSYPKERRQEMVEAVTGFIRRSKEGVTLYCCMESSNPL